MTISSGCLVISIDFELQWGVRDKRTLQSYGEAIKGGREAIPGILEIFDRYNIHSTWGIVGFLFAEKKEDIFNNIPDILPTYTNSKLSPYEYIGTELGDSEIVDPYHYASSLIKIINSTKNQEIATHTFSHYYCLEEGQTLEQFKADINSAIKIASPVCKLKTIIFPRNQFNEKYITAASDYDITNYRGLPDSYIYRSRSENNNLLIKSLRLLDSYIKIDKNHSYKLCKTNNKIKNIPSSRYLRPNNKKFPLLNNLKIRRIKQEMTYAAKNNEIYHLWWHPHNFGRNTENNLADLVSILNHYKKLKDEFGFISMNMGEISDMGLSVC